jgi:DinB superfamily
MQIKNEELIEELLAITKKSISKVESFKTLAIEKLNFKEGLISWSILECLEHLNLYADFYLPEIEKQIKANNYNTATGVFKSGVLGNYFVNAIQLKNGTIKKIKSPNDKNPINSSLSVATIDSLLQKQSQLIELLEKSKTANLTKTKTAISLTKLIKLRLGDTLRFFVYHVERHVWQAENIIRE